MASQLELLQEDVVERIAAIDLVSANGVKTLSQKQGNLEQMLQVQLSGLGCGIVVYPPYGIIRSPNTQGPRFEQIQVEVRVTVLPERFRAATSLAIAEEILRYLHLWSPEENFCLYGTPERPNPQTIDHDRLNIADIHLTTGFGLQPIT